MAVAVITTVTPSSGPAAGGTTINLVGTGFTGTTGVTVGGTAATSVVITDDAHLHCVTPAHAAGAVDVIVTNGSGDSSPITADHFTFVAAPVVTSVTPSHGPEVGGTSLAVVGTGFTGATAVTVGGTAATSFVVNNDTSLTVVAPGHAPVTNADLLVTTVGGTSSAVSGDHYTFDAPAEGTYTQTPGSAAGNQYFMDVEISPATLASGRLKARLDPVEYPETGKIEPPKQGSAAFPSPAPTVGA